MICEMDRVIKLMDVHITMLSDAWDSNSNIDLMDGFEDLTPCQAALLGAGLHTTIRNVHGKLEAAKLMVRLHELVERQAEDG